MNTLVKVGRYHLVDRISFLILPLGITLFSFAINLLLFWLVVPEPEGHTGGVMSLFIYMAVIGALSATRSLPFGLTLGVSRRSYYLGTVALAAGLGVAFGLWVVLMQLIERLADGWGIGLHFFRVTLILDGPWYVSWLTSFVFLVLMTAYGLWAGLVFRRWSVLGLVTFIAAQVLVLVAATLVITWLDGWARVGEFFTGLGALGMTGIAAALAVVLLGAGFATIRRVTV